jgi:hypothetical protein
VVIDMTDILGRDLMAWASQAFSIQRRVNSRAIQPSQGVLSRPVWVRG